MSSLTKSWNTNENTMLRESDDLMLFDDLGRSEREVQLLSRIYAAEAERDAALRKCRVLRDEIDKIDMGRKAYDAVVAERDALRRQYEYADVDAVKVRDDDIARLEAKLAKYGVHPPNCSSVSMSYSVDGVWYKVPCNCGLDP